MTTALVADTWLERAVRAFLAAFAYDDVVGPAWLEQHLEIRWPEKGSKQTYQRVALEQFARMDALRTALLEDHKIALRSIGKGNYHVVTPDEQHRFAMEQLRHGLARETKRAWRVIENTRTELVSPVAMKAREETVAKLAAFEAMSRKRLRGPLPTTPAAAARLGEDPG